MTLYEYERMAGRNYVIDRHPQKQEIIKAILEGESFRRISSQFNITDKCVGNYAENVLKKDLSIYVAKQKEQNLNTIDGLVQRLNKLAEVCQKVIDRCVLYLSEDGEMDVTSSKRDTHAILKDNIKNLKDILETIGRFLGMVKDINVVNNINIDTSKYIAHVAEIIEDTVTNPIERDELVRRLYEGI